MADVAKPLAPPAAGGAAPAAAGAAPAGAAPAAAAAAAPPPLVVDTSKAVPLADVLFDQGFVGARRAPAPTPAAAL